MTVRTIDRLPLGCLRHPSADVFAHDLASWHTPGPELPGSVPAPSYESELR